MDLNSIRTIVSVLLGKNKPGSVISTEQFNALLNLCQLKHLKACIGLPEDYQPGQWLSRRAPEVTRVVSEAIRPFIVMMGKDDTGYLAIVNGYADVPEDYFYPLSMYYNTPEVNEVSKVKKIEIVTDLRWEFVVSSHVVYPTLMKPYCNFKSDYIQFAPKEITSATFTYVRKPAEAMYVLKETADGFEYDEENSVQLEWNDINQLDIITLMLEQLSISIGRADLYSISEKIKTQGI